MSRAPRSRSGLPAFNRTTPPHLPFFYPAVVPPRCTVYSVWIGRSYCETRPGFPHSARPRFVVPGEALKPPGLRWHCPRPPGDSAQACSLSSTPVAISQPPPSSRPSAFSAARLPSPRYGFARSAPLRFASRRVAPRRAALPFRIFLPAFLVSFAFLGRPSLSLSFSYYRFYVSYAATRLRNCYSSPASTDKFHASYTTSSSPVPPRRGLNGTRPRRIRVLSPASHLEKL